MIAVIRTCPQRAAHAHRTVENLMRSNGDSEQRIVIVSSAKKPNLNGLDTLEAGIALSPEQPFIFLEDDVEFIADFNKAAETFYQNIQGIRSLIVPLCANYTSALQQCRGLAWRYPVSNFYGTQAFIIAPQDAALFIEWARKRELPRAGFDLILKDWAKSCGKTHFMTPYCSFVQHMGVDSALHNGRFHYYATWPGRNWRYQTGAFNLKEQQNRRCDIGLTEKIAAYFGKTLPAYDFGASTGLYVKALRDHRLTAMGFDATPGIASDIVKEVDLSRPQTFQEPKGNVMCLEVAEHIHPEKEKHLIQNISSLCAGKLVISWAVPGQGGRRHVNERDRAYVIPIIENSGFKLNMEQTMILRSAASIPWFKNTVYAFARK